MIELGTRRELFVDHHLIDSLDGLSLQLQKPVAAGRAITFDAPWEGAFCGYSTVIQEADHVRLYYRGWPNPPKEFASVYCLATSADGREFTRMPIGDPTRNLIDCGPHADAFAPMIDTRPGCPADERYKAMANDKSDGKRCLRALVSADGITWRRLDGPPAITKGAFDSLNVPFWSETEGCYVCYFRSWTAATEEKVFGGVRTISRATSADFRTWSEPLEMQYGDTPREELYTNNTFPYPRAPHIYIALPKRFVKPRQTHSDEAAAAAGILPPYHTEVSDGCFMTTRGGDLYDRTFMEAFVRPGRDQTNWVSRSNMSTQGLIQTAPDELSLYYHHRYATTTPYLQRYTLRVDGFASLHAPYAGGTMTSKLLSFSGDRLSLNYATSAPGTIRVALLDETGAAIPGHGLDDCDPIWGDRIDRTVTWGGTSDLGALRGRTLRLQIQMHDADVYAFQFLND